jgi:hypothetical protein
MPGFSPFFSLLVQDSEGDVVERPTACTTRLGVGDERLLLHMRCTSVAERCRHPSLASVSLTLSTMLYRTSRGSFLTATAVKFTIGPCPTPGLVWGDGSGIVARLEAVLGLITNGDTC